VFAPYVDMGLTVDWQLLNIQQQSGIKVFTSDSWSAMAAARLLGAV
jgi:hypothetical protein